MMVRLYRMLLVVCLSIALAPCVRASAGLVISEWTLRDNRPTRVPQKTDEGAATVQKNAAPGKKHSEEVQHIQEATILGLLFAPNTIFSHRGMPTLMQKRHVAPRTNTCNTKMYSEQDFAQTKVRKEALPLSHVSFFDTLQYCPLLKAVSFDDGAVCVCIRVPHRWFHVLNRPIRSRALLSS